MREDLHIGRSWDGPGHLERACPCPKEACGLVRIDRVNPDCPDHPWGKAKTIRCGHRPEDCQGATHFVNVK